MATLQENTAGRSHTLSAGINADGAVVLSLFAFKWTNPVSTN